VYLTFFHSYIAVLKTDKDSEAVSTSIIRERTQTWNLICLVLSIEPISVPVRDACIYRKGNERTEKFTISYLMWAYIYFLTTKYCLKVNSCIYFWRWSIWECDSLHHPAHLSSLQHTVLSTHLCTNPGRQVAAATRFYTVAPAVCGPCVELACCPCG
jgi:hypothetical protein